MPAFANAAYASKAVVKTPVEIPEDLPAGAALALLVQGLTAWHLLRAAARLAPGESVVINAAAGRLRPVTGAEYRLEEAGVPAADADHARRTGRQGPQPPFPSTRFLQWNSLSPTTPASTRSRDSKRITFAGSPR